MRWVLAEEVAAECGIELRYLLRLTQRGHLRYRDFDDAGRCRLLLDADAVPAEIAADVEKALALGVSFHAR